MKRFDEVFERPHNDELMPIMVLWRTGGSYRDYICAGLVDARELIDYQRGRKPPGYQLLVWEPRTIIRYNRESGGLRGLSRQAPILGGYGVETSLDGPAAMGEPLEVSLMTPEAWEGVCALAPVS